MSKTESSWKTESHELFDGDCKALRTNQNGDVYQLHVWVKEEKKLYRRSLRTKHLDTALSKGKEEYINIMSRVSSDKKIFSDDVTTVSKKFLDWKYEDIKSGTIVRTRRVTINTHFEHMLRYLHRDMKVGDIHTGTFLGYFNLRKDRDSSVKETTVSGEYRQYECSSNTDTERD
jgi:hypothetical protein